jgi:hypothetical protein
LPGQRPFYPDEPILKTPLLNLKTHASNPIPSSAVLGFGVPYSPLTNSAAHPRIKSFSGFGLRFSMFGRRLLAAQAAVPVNPAIESLKD